MLWDAEYEAQQRDLEIPAGISHRRALGRTTAGQLMLRRTQLMIAYSGRNIRACVYYKCLANVLQVREERSGRVLLCEDMKWLQEGLLSAALVAIGEWCCCCLF